MILWQPDFQFIWSPSNFDVRRSGLGVERARRSSVAWRDLRGSMTASDVSYVGPVLSGQVAYRPRSTANVAGGVSRWSARLEVATRYVGIAANRAASGLNLLDAYSLTDVALSRPFTSGSWRLDARIGVDNVFDRAASMLVDYPFPGRAWTVGLRATAAMMSLVGCVQVYSTLESSHMSCVPSSAGRGRSRSIAALGTMFLVAAASCSDDTSAPIAPGFLGGTSSNHEVGVVVNSTGKSVTLFQLGSPATQQQIALGTSSTVTPTGLAVRGRRAAVPLGNAASVALINLETAAIQRFFVFSSGNATGAAFADDTTIIAANTVTESRRPS